LSSIPSIEEEETTTTTSASSGNYDHDDYLSDDEDEATRKGREQQERDAEAFGILHHSYMARRLVTDPDLILQIGQLGAPASEYHVTAGSHEQFDTMLQFVLELLGMQQQQ
jgi:hypothetical protein